MEKEKMIPHIIVVVVLVAFVTLCVSCVSAPNDYSQAKEIVYDPSIPNNQLATLFIPPGNLEVFQFNGKTLNPKWFQMSLTSPGTNVKIPAGKHNIVFNYYGGEQGTNMNNVKLDIDIIAGSVLLMLNLPFLRQAYKVCQEAAFRVRQYSCLLIHAA